MFTFISNLLKLIPVPWRYIVEVGLLVLLVMLLLGLFSRVRSCSYDKARREYQVKEDSWKDERTKLISRAEISEKRVLELEPKSPSL